MVVIWSSQDSLPDCPDYRTIPRAHLTVLLCWISWISVEVRRLLQCVREKAHWMFFCFFFSQPNMQIIVELMKWKVTKWKVKSSHRLWAQSCVCDSWCTFTNGSSLLQRYRSIKNKILNWPWYQSCTSTRKIPCLLSKCLTLPFPPPSRLFAWWLNVQSWLSVYLFTSPFSASPPALHPSCSSPPPPTSLL